MRRGLIKVIEKFLRFAVVFAVIFSWIFGGWPQFLNFPPKIQEARATITTVYASSNSADGSLTGWLNATYVYSDDGVNYATRTGTTKNEWYGTLFGFDLSGIPDGSTINSVTITAEWHNSAADTNGPVLYVGAKSGGSEVGTGTSDTTGQTTPDELVTNSPTGLTAANLKATGANGFWAILRFRRTDNTGHIASADYVKVTVDYTPPPSITAPANVQMPDYTLGGVGYSERNFSDVSGLVQVSASAGFTVTLSSTALTGTNNTIAASNVKLKTDGTASTNPTQILNCSGYSGITETASGEYGLDTARTIVTTSSGSGTCDIYPTLRVYISGSPYIEQDTGTLTFTVTSP